MAKINSGIILIYIQAVLLATSYIFYNTFGDIGFALVVVLFVVVIGGLNIASILFGKKYINNVHKY